MENSTVDYDGQTEESSPSHMNHIDIPYIIVYVVAFLLGITGNGLVIWFGVFRMKKRVRVIWFLSLAVADFIFTLTLPFIITYKALDHWPFGSFLCKSSVFFYFFNMSVSGLQLMVISVDQCIHVTFPQWCHHHRTSGRAFIVVFIIWILSAASCVMFFIFTDTPDYNSIVSCRFSLDRHGTNVNIIIRSVLLILVPLVVIVTSYIGISIYNLIKHIPLCSKPSTVTLAVVIAFFVFCSPFNLFHILMISSAIDYLYVHNVAEVTECIRVISGCINPIIYILFGWEFKGNFCNSFLAIFEKAFAEEDNVDQNKREERRDSLNLEAMSH
ncbi:chemerin-like receptor 2 [Engystomops pustulosus]|uniref:chemerin-like receptor 2 n=1 Tax=Engystomops pustulosus TaxID=76066 RepID=UPI003AFB3CB5